MDNLRFAKRNHVVRAGIGGASEGLAIQALMFEKQYRIVATDGCAQQARGVLRVRRENDAQTGNVRKDALATLRVVDGTAGKVSADGNANHDWAGESIV